MNTCPNCAGQVLIHYDEPRCVQCARPDYPNNLAQPTLHSRNGGSQATPMHVPQALTWSARIPIVPKGRQPLERRTRDHTTVTLTYVVGLSSHLRPQAHVTSLEGWRHWGKLSRQAGYVRRLFKHTTGLNPVNISDYIEEAINQ